jgi:Leucine-rich repeat (LRR) protein
MKAEGMAFSGFVTIEVGLVKGEGQEPPSANAILCQDLKGTAEDNDLNGQPLPNSGELIPIDALNQEVSNIIDPEQPDIKAYLFGESGSSYFYIHINGMMVPEQEGVKTWIKIGLSSDLVEESTQIHVDSSDFISTNKLETIFSTSPTLDITFTGDKEIGHFEAEGAIPDMEINALTALYNSTNGDNWTRKDSWLGQRGTECDWFGVTCEEGHVIGLSLPENNLDGTLPEELGNLTYLKELSLNDNKLTGSIPTTFGNLTALTTLDMGANALTGNIPKELGNLESLSVIGLSRNKLSGTIPTELGNLSQLTQLNLEENELSGEIPPELGNLNNLILLSLFGNKLTGSIPASLGNLILLQYLFLGNNQLSGEIPPELGSLIHLIKLHLMNNLLTGEIPSELGNLSSLTELDMASNQLTGEIPASRQLVMDFLAINISSHAEA